MDEYLVAVKKEKEREREKGKEVPMTPAKPVEEKVPPKIVKALDEPKREPKKE